jgi:hypothetical protein
MRVTLTLDEHNPQERVILRRLQVLSRQQTRRPGSPVPFSWLEQGIDAALHGLEWAVQRMVCAFVR